MCDNPVQVPMEATNRAVLGAIRDLLSPDLVADVLARLRQLCDAPAVADPRSPIVAELADVEAQLERLTDTIALAGNVASVVQRLRRLEHRRQALAETLEAFPASPPPLPRIDWRLVERQAQQLMRTVARAAPGRRRRRPTRAAGAPRGAHPVHAGARRGAPRLSLRGRHHDRRNVGGNRRVPSLASPGRIELPA